MVIHGSQWYQWVTWPVSSGLPTEWWIFKEQAKVVSPMAQSQQIDRPSDTLAGVAWSGWLCM